MNVYIIAIYINVYINENKCCVCLIKIIPSVCFIRILFSWLLSILLLGNSLLITDMLLRNIILHFLILQI